MNTLYLECSMGASGDMLAAALLSLLSDQERTQFLQMMQQLLPDVQLTLRHDEKCGLQGLHFHVSVQGIEEHSAHSHEHGAHSHEHSAHSHEHSAHSHEHSAHSHEHGAHSHEHSAHTHEHGAHSHEHGTHSHEHGAHSHEHSAHTHEHSAHSHEHSAHSHEHSAHTHEHSAHSHEHGAHSHEHSAHSHEHSAHSHEHSAHTHEHGAHSHEHGTHTHEHGAYSHEHTNWSWVQQIFHNMDLPPRVRTRALSVYERIAQAEALAHGKPVAQVHFHEVGAWDAIADVTAVCLLVDLLSPQRILASTVHTGFGTVRCAHGILPVPAPATALLLRGIPTASGQIQGELCTPTGAALLAELVQEFIPMPPMRIHQIGIGTGTKSFEQANVLRAFWGTASQQAQTVWELSCNLDDMTGEQLSEASEQLWKAGALDVWITPIQMKKNRPAVMLSCLSHEAARAELTETMLAHTTTWGVRAFELQRTTVPTQHTTVITPYGKVRIKHTASADRYKAEWDDVVLAATSTQTDVRRVQRAAESAFEALSCTPAAPPSLLPAAP